MQVALLLLYREPPLVAAGEEPLRFRLVQTHTQPAPYWLSTFANALCDPRGTLIPFSSFLIILSVFMNTFFSFMLPLFFFPQLGSPPFPLDKCVYGISHVYKLLHKLLSKINKSRAKRSGGWKEGGRGGDKNEGQGRKNTE